MNLYIILGLVFTAVFLVVFMPAWMMARKNNPSAKRFRNMDDELSGKSESKSKKQSKGDNSVKQRAQKVLVNMQLNSKKKKKKTNPKIEERLQYAGFRNENAAAVLNGIKLISAGLFFTAAFVPLTFGIIENPFTVNPMLIALGAGFFGFGIPEMVLGKMAKKRQTIIDEGLPDGLDLLVICVEAGLGLNAAILRTGQDMKLRSVQLSDEFMLVTREMRTGRTREQALRNLADRNNVEDLKILVQALVLADKLGMSVASTLRAQSDALRLRVRQRAEEKAAKVGVKMLIPLALFILPALFAVLLGPALISSYDMITKM